MSIRLACYSKYDLLHCLESITELEGSTQSLPFTDVTILDGATVIVHFLKLLDAKNLDDYVLKVFLLYINRFPVLVCQAEIVISQDWQAMYCLEKENYHSSRWIPAGLCSTFL